MSEENNLGNCYHCKKTIETLNDAGLSYCMGGAPEYLCLECNEKFGEFEFKRKLQIINDQLESQSNKKQADHATDT